MMSTNERFTYDGLFKISFEATMELYIYDSERNPLGVPANVAKELHGKITDPRVLEYKFSLDGLIEDFDNLDKNIKDVNLCVCWSTGDLYKEKFAIVSLLIPENADQREYHGVTHVLTDIENGSKYCDLIVLEELIMRLNNEEQSAGTQRGKYD